MLKINTVTILGANGIMGSNCGGLIAAFGNAKIFMVARTTEKANEGIFKAIASIRSDVIKTQLIPLTYDKLSYCIPRSDWILEALSEDIGIKHYFNIKISKFTKPRAIISTISSGLSITELASDFNKNIQKYFFGTHFFNPPYKMLLCEIIPNPNSSKKIQKDLIEYLEKILRREVIVSKDKPAYVGNRIGFEVLNEALIYAEKYSIPYIDYPLGGITGRIMPPIQTIDLIGLDIYKTVAENMDFKIPNFVKKLISAGKLGNKTGNGFYKFIKNKKYYLDIKKQRYQVFKEFDIDLIRNVKEKIREGKYKDAINLIINSNTEEAKIIQYFFAKYIHVPFSVVGSVAENKEDVDKAMGYGFNWLPPSALIDLIGGKLTAINLLNKFNLDIPIVLAKHKNISTFYTLQDRLEYCSFLRAI